MPFKYSVACPTLQWTGYDVVEDPKGVLTSIKEAGFDGADLPVEGVEAEAMKPIIDAIGLAIPEMMGQWGYVHSGENRDLTSLDEEVRLRGIDYSRKAIDLAAHLGAQFFNVCASQPPVPQVPFPKAPISVLRDNFGKSLRSICVYAAENGTTILLEPLNLYEAIPGVLTSVYDALAFIDNLQLGNLGVQPDIFHMNISESSPTGALLAAGHWAKVVHMNETNHDRIGTGHADFKAIMRTLKYIDFDGWITVYAPIVSQAVFQKKAQSPNRPDLVATLSQQLRFLKEIEDLVETELARHR